MIIIIIIIIAVVVVVAVVYSLQFFTSALAYGFSLESE